MIPSVIEVQGRPGRQSEGSSEAQGGFCLHSQAQCVSGLIQQAAAAEDVASLGADRGCMHGGLWMPAGCGRPERKHGVGSMGEGTEEAEHLAEL